MSNGNGLWRELAGAGGVVLSDGQVSQLNAYLDALIEKNKVLNLTRITDRADAEIKHVADALTLLRFIPKTAKTLADVGTGGGIPGVILAIVRPDLNVTLIDATRKKLDAVLTICDAVGVTNVRTHHGRVETVTQKFDIVTARAVAELGKLLGFCRGLVLPRSVVLAMKGPRVREEIAGLSPLIRRQWTVKPHAVEIETLTGHVIVEARLKS